MSRDAYDDGYDDGGGRGGGRGDDGNYDDGEGRPGSEQARAKAQKAGTILLWFGLFSMLWPVLITALKFVAPDQFVKPLYDFQNDLLKNQPGFKPQPYDEHLQQQQVFGAIGAALNVAVSIPIILGGLRMRKLQSYGLAMTGAILSMIPCLSGCCLLGLPVGIWALVVLMNADVKDAFRYTAQRAAGY